MHCYLVIDLDAFLIQKGIRPKSTVVTLDYFLYTKVREFSRCQTYCISEFVDNGLIDKWQEFINEFISGLSQYLCDAELRAYKWLNLVDRPLVLQLLGGMGGGNTLNVFPRLLCFIKRKNITRIEIVGEVSYALGLFLKSIEMSLNIDVKVQSVAPIARPALKTRNNFIKRFLSRISGLERGKECVVLPDANVPNELKRALIDTDYKLGIIDPPIKAVKKYLGRGTFYFSGIRNSSDIKVEFSKIEHEFDDIDFSESLFQLVKGTLAASAASWVKEMDLLRGWIRNIGPKAIVVSDVQEVIPRLLSRLGQEEKIPSFHLPHGLYFVNKQNLPFIPVDMTDYITVPSQEIKEYYVKKLHIEAGKIKTHRIYWQQEKLSHGVKTERNIVILQYGGAANDFFQDYSLIYRLPFDLIREIARIFPTERIVYRERPGPASRTQAQVREYLRPLYEKGLFRYDTNKAIWGTLMSAKLVIGKMSTIFLQAIASNTPYYCYNPAKIELPPPFRQDCSFMFTEVEDLGDVLSMEYPLQSLKDAYLKYSRTSDDSSIIARLK